MLGKVLFRIPRSLCFLSSYSRLIIIIAFLQVIHLPTSLSQNATNKNSQISNKNDWGKISKDPPYDLALRRNLPRCGGIYTVRPGDHAFRIFSPDYPLPYPSLSDCIYDIKFKGGSFPCHLDFRFEDFFLSSDPPDCFGDRLEIGGQRFCGGLSGAQRFETQWTSNGERHLLIRLVTDGVGTGRGFRICISQVPCIGPLPIPPSSQPPIYPPNLPDIPPPFPSSPIIPPNPPFDPPRRPPYDPPYIPPRPVPPLYPTPPLVPPWGLTLPRCCATQQNGHRIHLASPGFPHQLPGGSQCSYVINRHSPQVTHLRVNFKYFNLPCPVSPLQYQFGLPNPFNSRVYLNIDGKNICGCRTGLTITIPFRRFERQKILFLYNPSVIPISRSNEDNTVPFRANNTSSLYINSKEDSHFKPSVPYNGEIHSSKLTEENSQSSSQQEHGVQKSSVVLFPSSPSALSKKVDGSVVKESQKRDGEVNQPLKYPTQHSSNSKADRTFGDLFNNRPIFRPPLGFLLEVVQEVIEYIPGRRTNTISNGVRELTTDEATSRSTLNAAPRYFQLPPRSCSVNDWPQVKWWILWLHKKGLLEFCPPRFYPPERPPFIPPPFCDDPFIPIY